MTLTHSPTIQAKTESQSYAHTKHACVGTSPHIQMLLCIYIRASPRNDSACEWDPQVPDKTWQFHGIDHGTRTPHEARQALLFCRRCRGVWVRHFSPKEKLFKVEAKKNHIDDKSASVRSWIGPSSRPPSFLIRTCPLSPLASSSSLVSRSSAVTSLSGRFSWRW